MMVFGGFGGSKWFDELWVFDTHFIEWYRPEVRSAAQVISRLSCCSSLLCCCSSCVVAPLFSSVAPLLCSVAPLVCLVEPLFMCLSSPQRKNTNESWVYDTLFTNRYHPPSNVVRWIFCHVLSLLDNIWLTSWVPVGAVRGEVGGWGRDPKQCTGRDWGMGSSTI